MQNEINEDCRKAVQYIFELNILCGNALSMKKVDENGNDTAYPIMFAEWSFVQKGTVKRRDYRLDVLLNENVDENSYAAQLSLFEGDITEASNWMTDPETRKPIPKPTKEYPLMDYRRIQGNG